MYADIRILANIIPRGRGHTALYYQSKGLSDGFKELGCQVKELNCLDGYAVEAEVNAMLSGEYYASVGLNNIHMQVKDKIGKSIYNNFDMPCVSVMLDAPYSPHTGNWGTACNNHFVTVLDKTYIEAIDLVYPNKNFAGKMFMPLAGDCDCNDSDIFSVDRPLDVVYSASMWSDGHPVRDWNDDGTAVFLCNILNDIADLLENVNITVIQGVKYVLQARGMNDSRYLMALSEYFWPLLHYIKAYRRIKGLELLVKNDIQVDVFGSGWENIYFADKLNLHGNVDYCDMLKILSKAKVVFQDQAEFNNGAHDRVFSSVLSGAVVVSEYSSYLDEIFDDGKDIFLYDWKNGLSQVQVINDLINDENMRLSVAISAYGKVYDNHRWVNRAKSILEMIAMN